MNSRHSVNGLDICNELEKLEYFTENNKDIEAMLKYK